MRESTLNTFSVPALGEDAPSRLTAAGATPLRVLVRNTGGVQVFLGFSSQDLTNVTSTGSTYQLPPNASDVIVLAPGQSLFAASLGGGGTVSIAVSEAIPLSKSFMES